MSEIGRTAVAPRPYDAYYLFIVLEIGVYFCMDDASSKTDGQRSKVSN